ncbi:MAG: thermonuclease family protein [Elainellaceae cyanobacterium]
MALILLKLLPQTDAPAVQSPSSDLWQVVPDSVYDGDTLRVMRNGEELKIRFCGIDAPEKDQALGVQSRDHLRSLIDQSNNSVRILTVERDRYGRTVAEVMGVLGESEMNLNAQMVADGMAYHYAQYSGNCPSQSAIVEAEAIAQEARVGVWANPASEKPWDWRQRN